MNDVLLLGRADHAQKRVDAEQAIAESLPKKRSFANTDKIPDPPEPAPDVVIAKPPVSPEREVHVKKSHDPPQAKPTEHQLCQQLIKRYAEGLGFKAVIEQPTSSGGRVDVGLSLGVVRIACEISVTTTAKHELGNIRKCLKAGYDIVVACSTEKKQLDKIRSVAEAELEKSELKKVHCLNPKNSLKGVHFWV